MNGRLVVRTVLGDVDPADLGVLDYHEHLFQVSPLLPGEELDDEDRSGREARSLKDAGVGAMVEATPAGLGAHPEAVARISAAHGLHVVHTTGAHHGGHYADGHPLLERTAEQLAGRFTADVSTGLRRADSAPAITPNGDPVRAGLVKAGIRYWAIGDFESRVLDAVAATSVATGCAVMVHLDFGSAAHEVLDRLGAAGVAADRVVLAHMDRNLDPGLHASLAERGAYLGYDGMARHREAPDSAILQCLVEAVSERTPGGRAAALRIVLGGDVARRSRYMAYGGMPGLAYLPLRFLPRLRAAVDARVYAALTTHNGQRLLSLPVG
jgi:predicted metal-dependent phosphotriesterase family hydrolase